ncbi:MAG: DNA adenine methylase [Nitrospirae bacterium]|nr:MAG: DNA adenine methylase [Nitrospirota bacterium]
MRHLSPLRYPGGKSVLANFLTNIIDLNDLRGCAYFEPYAGGAGAALSLVRDDVVSEIYLNDADDRIYAFWRSVQLYPERFIERIITVPLTIEEWYRQHEICSNTSKYSQFDVGFATFFMNRCNRSGVLSGSGPIGGYEQRGKWRIDVRFNREGLSQRIIALSRYRGRIHVSCKDAIAFLKTSLPRGRGRDRNFIYLDPPYVNNGQRLYLNAYSANDHVLLAKYLCDQRSLPWVVSYDDSGLIRELYTSLKIALLPIKYTLQQKRSAHELIIAPHHLSMPSACRLGGRESFLRKIA